MFRSSSKEFKRYYYMSSLLPIHILILLVIILYKIEKNQWISLTLSFFTITIMIIIAMIIIEFFSLIRVIQMLKNQKKLTKAVGTIQVKVLSKYNNGLRDFVLSFILPILSTFSVNDYPFSTIIIILIFQILVYIFYKNSSDFFPNISLMILGYSIFEVDKKMSGNIQYIFGRTSDIDKLILNSVTIISLGDKNYPNNVGIVVGKR